MRALSEVVSTLAEELRVPGVAVGMLHDGEEHHAFHGVTSVENPLPVDERTLFLCGSTTKTFTATALMRLVDQGHVDLNAPRSRLSARVPRRRRGGCELGHGPPAPESHSRLGRRLLQEHGRR